MERIVDDAGLADLLEPRTSPIAERVVAPGTFELANGPFEYYERTVTVVDTEETAGDDRSTHRHRVIQRTEYELALSIWSGLFVPLINRTIVDPPAAGKTLWWAPPDVLDARAARSLSILCIFSAFAGYLGVLLSQTNTYFKDDFGASSQSISFVLIGVRIAGLLALFIMAFADRRGRRAVLLFATYTGIALAAAGAFAPNLIFLGTTQTLARAFSAAIGLLVAIMAAEEMPSNSRAFSVSVLSMTAALGAGGVVSFLKIADLAPWAWRVFYLVPLVMIIPTRRLAKRLPETRRFEVLEAQEELGVPGAGTGNRSHARRFIILAVSAFLLQMFFAPASSFMNDFLRNERGYDGLRITLMQVLTNLPGGLSIVVGGMLADRYGRRIVGGIGLGAGALFTVLM
ncbi:MAG: MFS transporter, partial [Acidimicrobiales bacterium]|nr:MFS transporter [Acidimicrobiales bacterium]